jgi:hypothetical protein
LCAAALRQAAKSQHDAKSSGDGVDDVTTAKSEVGKHHKKKLKKKKLKALRKACGKVK